MPNDLAKSWQRITKWYAANTPKGTLKEAKGASEAQIKSAEEILGVRLPEDVREFFGMCNGLAGSWFLHYGEFLSLDGLLHQWEMYGRMQRQDKWGIGNAWKTEYLKGPIKPIWWNPLRLPLADNSGDHAMLDLDPAPKGSKGQIIAHCHECGPLRVLAPSFRDWLSRIAWALEAGKLTWQEKAKVAAPPGYYEPGGWLKDWESDWAKQ